MCYDKNVTPKYQGVSNSYHTRRNNPMNRIINRLSIALYLAMNHKKARKFV